MTGKRFGPYLVLVETAPEIRPNGKRRRKWLVRHDDGTERVVRQDKLDSLTHDPLQRNLTLEQRVLQLVESVEGRCCRWTGHLDRSKWPVMTIHLPRPHTRR